MRSFYLLVFLAFAASDCHQAGPQPALGCADTKYRRSKELTNAETVILLRANGYLIDRPDGTDFLVPLWACNLPEAYKKDQLKVRISGYTLTYPGMENDLSIAIPFELTRIDVR